MNLTDEQVMEVLKCCTNEDLACKDCPSHDLCDNNTFEMLRCILDLIKRKEKVIKFSTKEIVDLKIKVEQQRAEIERLRKVLENRGEICKSCDEKYTEKIKRAKADAIKEFADKAIKRICERVTPIPAQSYLVERCNEEIRNLVKEMVGD